MRGIVGIALVVGLAGATANAGEEPKRMTAADFVVDWQDLKGKTVTVTGCQLVAVSTDYVICRDGAVTFFFDSTKAEKEGRRRTLKTCTGSDEKRECIANLTGTVTEWVGGGASLAKVTFDWLAP